MSPRRRAALLLGLSAALGGLAASEVARREAALDRRLGPLVPVLVARAELAPGDALTPARLAVRRVPRRYAPPSAYGAPGEVSGLRAAVAVPRGADLVPGAVALPDSGRAGAPVREGERVAELVALGSPEAITAGVHVDVLVTREPRDGDPGGTEVALENAEVLAATPSPSDVGGAEAATGSRVTVSLRVSYRQAVYLAAAQSFARELRLLPRAAGDVGRGGARLRVGPSLR